MNLIYHDYYNLIRKSLSSSTPKIVKTGIQEMLEFFECGRNFANFDKKSQKDFHSYIYKILQNKDFDVRKWIYHLLCVYNDPIDMSRLINASLENIEIEADGNIENISWIVAACGAHAKSKEAFEAYLKEKKIDDYLTNFQIKIASSAFREVPFYDINGEDLCKAIGYDDFISPIWITKIYANKYKYYNHSALYQKYFDDVSTEVLADLLNHPNEVVRKYSMWAYAQNINNWQTPVKLEDVLNQEPGVLKWNLVKLFQNKDFLETNSDFIQEIESKIKNLKTTEKEGIILGCKKLGYSDKVSNLLVSWSQAIGEDNENLLLNLYSYFAIYASYNDDYFEITRSAIDNIDNLPGNLQSFYKGIQNTKIEGFNLNNQFINYNIQNINNGSGTQNNNITIKNNTSESLKEELLKEIKEARELLEKKDFTKDDHFDDLKNHIEYELQAVSPDWSNENPQLKTITDKLEELKKSKVKNRKTLINNFLSTLANVVTVLSATQFLPNIILFFRNIVAKIIEFLG